MSLSNIFYFYSVCSSSLFSFFSNDTSPSEIYTLSLHDALPICVSVLYCMTTSLAGHGEGLGTLGLSETKLRELAADRKSTRLNSSHQIISYAVFCLKKKKRNRLTVVTYNLWTD